MKFVNKFYEFHKTNIFRNALRDGVIDGAALSASMRVRRHVAEGDFVFGLAAAGGVEVDFVHFDALLFVEGVEVREMFLEDGHHLFVAGDDRGTARRKDAARCRSQHQQERQNDGETAFHAFQTAFPCR